MLAFHPQKALSCRVSLLTLTYYFLVVIADLPANERVQYLERLGGPLSASNNITGLDSSKKMRYSWPKALPEMNQGNEYSWRSKRVQSS